MIENIIIKNLSLNESLELDREHTPSFVLDSADLGSIRSELHSYKFINQIGETLSNISLGTRDIEIIGWIVARSSTEMTRRKLILNRIFNPLHNFTLYYRDYILNFNLDNTIQYSVNYPENNDVICKFQISGTCSNPLFEDKVETNVLAATTIPRFYFPLIISEIPNPPGGILMGYREPSLIASVYNKSSIDLGLKIIFEAKGTLTNPSLLEIKTQEFIKINKEMKPGERIEINTEIGSKYIKGFINGQEYNYFKYRDFKSSWLNLKPGDNLFRYNADENIDNLEVTIKFKNKYLEVQECY